MILTVRFAAAGSPLDLYPALMDTLIGQHYAAARSRCDSLDQAYPGHPAGLYARAAVEYAHMIDFEDTLGRAQFVVFCDSAVAMCRDWKRDGRGNRAELSYLAASSLAAKGLLLNHEGRLLSALRLLIAAKSEFDDAIAAEPTFYDAYLGRGAYRYAVATHAAIVSWLPFIPSAESGWQDMWLAAERSRFSRFPALTSLVWFALDKRDFGLADSICRSGLQRYPSSRSFLWPKLALEYRQQMWEAAMATSQELLDQYLASPDDNGYETINLYHKLMQCADALGQDEPAREFARVGLTTFRTPDTARRRANKLAELEKRVSESSVSASDDRSP